MLQNNAFDNKEMFCFLQYILKIMTILIGTHLNDQNVRTETVRHTDLERWKHTYFSFIIQQVPVTSSHV